MEQKEEKRYGIKYQKSKVYDRKMINISQHIPALKHEKHEWNIVVIPTVLTPLLKNDIWLILEI